MRTPKLGPLSMVVLTVAVLVATTRDAAAYIDPSAGGMLVQLILGGTAGLAVLGKLFWGRIKRTLGVGQRDAAHAPSHESDSSPR